jgi:hypothetical protein
MSAEGERATLDGNAAGGLLREVFAFDATVAATTCAGCGRTRADGRAARLRHRDGRHPALPLMR